MLSRKIRHRSFDQTSLRWAARTKTSMIKFNVTLHELDVTLAIEFILWNNQSLHCSRTMCWLQPQIWRHFTALRPERKIWSFSQVVWVIRNSASTTIFLGVPKYWKPSCIVFLFRGSEILYPLLCCLGNQKFWILALLCCLGNQKFWIFSCVVWGSEILNPLPCCLGDHQEIASKNFMIPCKQGDVSCEF